MQPITASPIARLALPAALALLATGLAGCATPEGKKSAGAFPAKGLRVMAPAAPGGGWDQTSRELQGVLRKQVGKPVEVYNRGGAGGTVGLADFAENHKGDPYELMATGQIMVGAVETNNSPVKLDQTTPLVRLTADYEVIVVPKASPYKTVKDLTDALKADTKSVSIAGGSAGGTEQLLAGMIAKDIGADPSQVNYVAHSGGGEALITMLSGKVKAGISGISEVSDKIESGDLRPLAVSSPQRLPDVNAPTLKESGVDVELANWRGVMAPPGISDSDEKALEDMFTKLAKSPEWKQVLQKRGWQDNFLAGQEFETFLTQETKDVRAILGELGLT
ncbi:MAG: PhnD/SsuA/transferrin family substrate-binding protein [Streptosporangiales bacterium]|nr:PhnD/SsuA/transferrin family substrate-binding protein [Streptosporangiales bacterium]